MTYHNFVKKVLAAAAHKWVMSSLDRVEGGDDETRGYGFVVSYKEGVTCVFVANDPQHFDIDKVVNDYRVELTSLQRQGREKGKQ